MRFDATQKVMRSDPRLRSSAIHPHISRYKGPQEPRPYRSLVIGGVAAMLVTFIGCTISTIGMIERAQAHRCQQFLLHFFNHSPCAILRKHGVMQADGKDLVRANRSIWWIAWWPDVDDVIEALRVFVPECAVERLTGKRSQA